MLRTSSSVARVRRPLLPLLACCPRRGVACTGRCWPTSRSDLPGASSAEGIAAGRGSTFYAGDLFGGDIFRGDVQRGSAELFIDAPDGRMAVGMAADVAHDLLFVAGGDRASLCVRHPHGATVDTYQFASPRGHVHQRRRSDEGRRLVHRFVAGRALFRAGQ